MKDRLGIEVLLVEAHRLGFSEEEIEGVSDAYFNAYSLYEEKHPRPCAPGVDAAISYITERASVSSCAARLYMKKTIDRWQKKCE